MPKQAEAIDLTVKEDKSIPDGSIWLTAIALRMRSPACVNDYSDQLLLERATAFADDVLAAYRARFKAQE